MMHLLDIYSNHDLQGSLGRLAKKLAAVRANGGPRRQPVSRRQRPRRPGWVLEAIVQVLADRGESMQVEDIHAAVEALVGEPVPSSSVKGGLARTSRAPQRGLSEWRADATSWPTSGGPGAHIARDLGIDSEILNAAVQEPDLTLPY